MEWLNRLLGYRYLVNTRSGEIHSLDNEHRNCYIGLIASQNRKLVTHKQAARLMVRKGYNGCRWCMPLFDTDVYRKTAMV